MQDPSNPFITITTISGERVTATLVQWVQALILRLSPGDLLATLRMVQEAQSPMITIPRDTIEADPKDWLSGNGKRR